MGERNKYGPIENDRIHFPETNSREVRNQNFMRNHDIGVFKDGKNKEFIYGIADDLGISPMLAHSFMILESNGGLAVRNGYANPKTKAVGIMQITRITADDFEQTDGNGRGFFKYRKLFERINLNRIPEGEAKEAFKRVLRITNQSKFQHTETMNQEDRKQYADAVNALLDLARAPTYSKDRETANILIGLIYFKRCFKDIEQGDERKEELLADLPKINASNINFLNILLTNKNIAPVSLNELRGILTEIYTNPQTQKEFAAASIYNQEEKIVQGVKMKVWYGIFTLVMRRKIYNSTQQGTLDLRLNLERRGE